MNGQEFQAPEAARPNPEPVNVPDLLATIRHRTISLLEELTAKGPSYGLPEPATPMALAHHALVNGAYRLAVAAEKGVDSSTLINALVGHPVLPPDLARQTGFACLVQPPPVEQSQPITDQRLRLADDTTWPLAQLASAVINEEIASLGFEQLVRWIEVDTTIRYLPANTSLVNLPGFDAFISPQPDKGPAFEQFTRWDKVLELVLPETDAVIFIIGAAQPIDDTGLDLIQMLLDQTREIFFVQLIDIHTQTSEQGIETARTSEGRLADQFGSLLPNLHVWPISPELLLLAAQDDELLRADLHQTMMAALESLLFRVTGVRRAEQALVQAEEYYRDGLAVLAARLAGVSKQSAEERATQRDRIQGAIDELGRDWGQRGTKRRQLLNDLSAAFQNARQRFEDALMEIEEEHASKIAGLRKIEAATKLSEELERNLAKAAFESRRQVEYELRRRVLELLRPFAQQAEAIGTLSTASGSYGPATPRFSGDRRGDWSDYRSDTPSGGESDRATLTKEAVGLLGAIGLISAGVTPYVIPLITVWSLVQNHRLSERKNVERAKHELRERLHLIMSGIRTYYLADPSPNGDERVGALSSLIVTLRQNATTILDAVAESKANDVRQEMLALAEADKLGEHRRAQQETQLNQGLKDWYRLGNTLQELTDTIRDLEQTQPITPLGQSPHDRPRRPRPSSPFVPSETTRSRHPNPINRTDETGFGGRHLGRHEERSAVYGVETAALPRQLVVDANGGTSYRTIAEAIHTSNSGDTIRIRPGIYPEALVMEKDITLEGFGKRDEIVVETNDQPVVRVRSDGGRLANLTLRQFGGEALGAIDIERGSPVIELCDISSQTLDGIAIHGHDASPTIRQNQIHNAQTSGIFVFDHAHPLIEDNVIFANGTNGVSAMTGGNPHTTRNHIYNNQHSGVYVFDDGRGVFTDNGIFANTRDGIIFGLGSEITIVQNRIYRNTNSGVFVFDGGTGTIERNDIRDNGMNGVGIVSGGNPLIQDNQIHDNQHSAVYSFNSGRGTIRDNDLFDNGQNGIAIGSQSDPRVQANRIHDNAHSGVYVCEDGAGGTIEENDIFTNQRDGICIATRRVRLIARNRIHENGYNGVAVFDGGGATFRGNTVIGNTLKNWDIADLETTMPESSDRLVVTEPRDGQHVVPDLDNGAIVSVAGRLDPSEIKPDRIVEVIIRTDIDYPQGEVRPASDGTWRNEGNHLGGTVHRIFAVLRENGEPLFRSNVVIVEVTP